METLKRFEGVAEDGVLALQALEAGEGGVCVAWVEEVLKGWVVVVVVLGWEGGVYGLLVAGFFVDHWGRLRMLSSR